MSFRYSAVALTAALVLSACSRTEPEAAAAEAADASATEAVAADADAAAPPAPPAPSTAQPAAPGAPSFAVIYPGGVTRGAATLAESPAGPGGILEFTTDATPDAVVAFYEQRAEAAGLKKITSMSQAGGAGYSAGDGADGRGQLIQVIATAVLGQTSVQLSWSAGR